MGDVRFDRLLDRLNRSGEAGGGLGGLSDEDVIQALAAASKAKDPYLANVLATEAENRTLRLHALLDVLGDGVLRVDEQGRVVLLGGSAERLLGWSTSEARGRDAHALVHPHCGGREHCPLSRVLRGRSTTLGHAGRFARADGGTVEVGYRGFPMRRDGEVHGAALFFWPDGEGRAAEAEAHVAATRATAAPAARIHLTFYVSGSRPESQAAARNLERLLERAGEAIEVSTVDVERDPLRAEADHVVATPSLVRASSPLGERRVIGDLSEPDRVVRALEIDLSPPIHEREEGEEQ